MKELISHLLNNLNYVTATTNPWAFSLHEKHSGTEWSVIQSLVVTPVEADTAPEVFNGEAFFANLIATQPQSYEYGTLREFAVNHLVDLVVYKIASGVEFRLFIAGVDSAGILVILETLGSDGAASEDNG